MLEERYCAQRQERGRGEVGNGGETAERVTVGRGR